MNESYKNGLLGFEPAASLFLRLRSTTWANSGVTTYHLNVIHEQVNVYSAGTNFET